MKSESIGTQEQKQNDNQEPKSAIRIRAATETDAPFIFNSWLKCYRHSVFAKEMQNEVYFEAHHKLIEGMVGQATFLIACNDLDPAQIYGYAVGEHVDNTLVIHFIYMKEPYRKLGIAKLLASKLGWKLDMPFIYTHRTHQAQRFEKMGRPMVYHPYLAYYAYGRANNA